MTSEKVYSYKEVQKHNRAEDLWVIIHNKVYDLSAFVDEHPGGKRVLVEQAGSYSSEPFEDVGHSEEARALMDKYCVGVLDPTLIIPNAPPELDQLTNRLNSLSFCSSDQLRLSVERAILHAHLWQNDEVKLPRRFQPDLPIWRHKTEYGIEPTQSTRYLLHNLFRLMENEAPDVIGQLNSQPPTTEDKDLLPPRWLSRDRLVETYFQWGLDDKRRRVQFSQSSDLVLAGRHPLIAPPSVVSAEMDNQGGVMPWSSLGPMSPLIDLTTIDYQTDVNSDGWVQDVGSRHYPYPHLLTINLSLPNTWSDFNEPEADRITPQQRQASALMHCFALAVASARLHSLVNNEDGRLDRPVTLQGVCSDGVHFDFITFQLNTLRLPDSADGDDRHRNLAWVDGNHRLFDKQIPKRSMLRNTKYRDLDMRVFDRLMANYLWGQLTSTSQSVHESPREQDDDNNIARQLQQSHSG